jgi:hypothetical protein
VTTRTARNFFVLMVRFWVCVAFIVSSVPPALYGFCLVFSFFRQLDVRQFPCPVEQACLGAVELL